MGGGWLSLFLIYLPISDILHFRGVIRTEVYRKSSMISNLAVVGAYNLEEAFSLSELSNNARLM